MPGSRHDTFSVKCSSLGNMINCEVLRERFFGGRFVDDCSPRYVILADPAYRLQFNVLKTYTHVKHTPQLSALQQLFNTHHSRIRVAVEQFFGDLKIMFGSVGARRVRMMRKEVATLALACAVVHNLIVNHRGGPGEPENGGVMPVQMPAPDDGRVGGAAAGPTSDESDLENIDPNALEMDISGDEEDATGGMEIDPEIHGQAPAPFCACCGSDALIEARLTRESEAVRRWRNDVADRMYHARHAARGPHH